MSTPAVVAGRLWAWVLVLFAVLVRLLVGLHPYSGQGTPPRYGDFEAQRHWLELTIHKPVGEWYSYDVDWWGLDYPPLTAYHSWVLGKVANVTYPAMVALDASRGIETPETKRFMRWSAVLSDVAVFFPAVWLAATRVVALQGRPSLQFGVFYLALMHPCFIIVDHGHFQYNAVCLGLALLGMTLTLRRRALLGAVCLCLAVCFKQMALYYSPAFFFFLLGDSFARKGRVGGLLRVLALAATVLGTFAACFAPFWFEGGAEGVLQVLRRIFPVSRGIFEDKVANFWCALSVVYKVHLRHSPQTLFRASLVATVLGFLPSCVDAMRRPTRQRFVYALCVSSLSFYLFSFQVHEKSILFPILPLLLLFGETPDLVVWMGVIATASMFPLLKREGLAVPYVALQCFFLLTGWSFARSSTHEKGSVATLFDCASKPRWCMLQMARASLLGLVLVHVLGGVVLPPLVGHRYPHIEAMLLVVYAAAHFMFLWAALIVRQLFFLVEIGAENAGLESPPPASPTREQRKGGSWWRGGEQQPKPEPTKKIKVT